MIIAFINVVVDFSNKWTFEVRACTPEYPQADRTTERLIKVRERSSITSARWREVGGLTEIAESAMP